MTLIAQVFCLMLAGIGAVGIVAPAPFLALTRRVASRSGLYFAALARVCLGAVFLAAAADSRAPDTMRGLGFIVLVAGLAIPFLGAARWKALIEWWADQGEDLMRVSLAFALFGGLLLFYVFSPTI